MREVLGGPHLLRVWELGRNRHSIDRALLVLAAAHPDRSPEELNAFSIGRRDAELLEIRRSTFGSKLDGVVTCQACATEVEFVIDELRAEGNDGGPEPFEVVIKDRRLTLRPLDSRDLASVIATDDIEAARHVLARRAIVHVDGHPDEDTLDDDMVDGISTALAEHDPHADITVELGCPECGQVWEAPIDPTNVLWSEIADAARRVLLDVHTLASAYGWTENDVLTLTPERRQAYVELAGGA